MIIKSKSIKRKSNHCFRKLVNYVLSPDKGHELLFSRFIHGNIQELIKGFERNEENRLHKRTCPVKLHHEILSFSREDKDALLDKTKLKKLVKYYAKKRALQSPVVCALHLEEGKQPHLHLLFGIQLNGKALRIKKQEFEDIKQEMEKQQDLLFELNHSKINHIQKDRAKTTDAEYHIKRKGKKSYKDEQIENIQSLYAECKTPQAFIQQLNKSDIPTYCRRGVLSGVYIKNGKGKPTRKLRLSTLGFTKSKILSLHKAWTLEIKEQNNKKHEIEK